MVRREGREKEGRRRERQEGREGEGRRKEG
jgi:hypothetical protein